jgi:hypothetical protein
VARCVANERYPLAKVMMTPSAAAAANILSAAAAVVLFTSAASPDVAKRTAGRARSGGTKVAGESGRCLLTITHGLVGSERECCGPGAAAEGGRAADDGGTADGVCAAVVVLSGTGADDELAGGVDAAAAVGVELPVPGVGPGVPDGVKDWAGVQADSAARPVPASRRRLKARRLGDSGPASCRPAVPSTSS